MFIQDLSFSQESLPEVTLNTGKVEHTDPSLRCHQALGECAKVVFRRDTLTTNIDIGVSSIVSSRQRSIQDNLPRSVAQEDRFYGFDILYDIVWELHLSQQERFHKRSFFVISQ
jgi:hypothetical protein